MDEGAEGAIVQVHDVEDKLCNEAYDELLMHEFNPKTKEFDGDGGSEGDRDELCVAAKAGMC
jgi:hypothetical protein